MDRKKFKVKVPKIRIGTFNHGTRALLFLDELFDSLNWLY